MNNLNEEEIVKTTLRISIVLIIGLAFSMTTGCASKPEIKSSPETKSSPERKSSGFLTDYSKLSENTFDALTWGYEKDGVDWGTYDKIILEQVVFFVDENAEYKGIDPEDLAELTRYFYDKMVEAFTGFYSFTDKPGPRTFRLRIAITDLVPSKPAVGAWSTFMPPALILSHAKKATTGSHLGMGSVSFEIEAIDSQTNEVLGAAINKNQGKKYNVGKTFTKWGQVKAIFDDFAKVTRKRFEKLGGRQ
jgi:hypothetical protein